MLAAVAAVLCRIHLPADPMKLQIAVKVPIEQRLRLRRRGIEPCVIERPDRG